MIKVVKLLVGLFFLASFFSCVSKKKFLDLQSNCDEIRVVHENLQTQIAEGQKREEQLQASLRSKDNDLLVKENELSGARNKITSLETDLEYQKKTNTNLLDRLSDLSVINKTGAESIKKSLETLNEQTKYIKDLNSAIQTKDSMSLALVMNLKRALEDVNDEDIQVEVRKGVVYVSIADKLLFKSGSAEINDRAVNVLGKVARVIMDHKEIDVLVEGHTDNVPISTNRFSDNWDLSVIRATAVVRHLTAKHGVSPERLTAGGRGEFAPKTGNDTAQGRQENRRTEIIITPKLDQFFNLLASPGGGN